MEQLDEGFVGSTWVQSTAVHESPPATSTMSDDQQQAIDGSDKSQKQEPIRNRGQRIGRNDPCHCGSGKKFKNCCMRKG
jgi:preprotein translocase subunit SecA